MKCVCWQFRGLTPCCWRDDVWCRLYPKGLNQIRRFCASALVVTVFGVRLKGFASLTLVFVAGFRHHLHRLEDVEKREAGGWKTPERDVDFYTPSLVLRVNISSPSLIALFANAIVHVSKQHHTCMCRRSRRDKRFSNTTTIRTFVNNHVLGHAYNLEIITWGEPRAMRVCVYNCP